MCNDISFPHVATLVKSILHIIILAAGGACTQNFDLMRCGQKAMQQQVAQQQEPTIRLCQRRPDGSEDCQDGILAGIQYNIYRT